MEHLRPHPVEVSERKNIQKKFEFKQRTDKYLFAFNPSDYCDFEIFNITGEQTRAYPGVCAALRYSKIPTIFFFSYDVGNNETLGVFVRHVVCCLAMNKRIYFFDMRNLAEISKNMKSRIESEIKKYCGVDYEIINLSCNRTTQCRYLQRFKGDNEMGWCIGWALMFLDYLTGNPEITEKTNEELKIVFGELYDYIDEQLKSKRSNRFIEEYYIALNSSEIH